jgi:two-component system response regulator VanR
VHALLVEDEPYMAEAIRDGLRLEAIAADIARGRVVSAAELLERSPRVIVTVPQGGHRI